MLRSPAAPNTPCVFVFPDAEEETHSKRYDRGVHMKMCQTEFDMRL